MIQKSTTKAPDVTIDALKGWLGTDDSERVRLDWIIVGMETGPRARRLNSIWATGIQHDCAINGVPLYIKQASFPQVIPI